MSMRYTDCQVCHSLLMVRIVKYEAGNQHSWKEILAVEAYNLPSNEVVTSCWCPDCGILYQHDVRS